MSARLRLTGSVLAERSAGTLPLGSCREAQQSPSHRSTSVAAPRDDVVIPAKTLSGGEALARSGHRCDQPDAVTDIDAQRTLCGVSWDYLVGGH